MAPDILAPGVQIFASTQVAATSNGSATGEFWNGTSMSAPHIAGIAALIRSKHPSWGPSAIKSAIMTTAGQTTNRGSMIAGTPFDFGAGHVNVAGALDPGLVYNITDNGARYVCAVDPTNTPDHLVCDKKVCSAKTCGTRALAAGVNLPSCSLPMIKRGASVAAARELTCVGNVTTATFAPTVEAPQDFTVTIAKSLTFTAKKPVVKFTLALKASNTAAEGWRFGSLTWRDSTGRCVVRSPIAVQIRLA